MGFTLRFINSGIIFSLGWRKWFVFGRFLIYFFIIYNLFVIFVFNLYKNYSQ